MMLQLAPEPPTVEPRRETPATSVIRLPRYFGHFFSAQQNDHTFPYLKKTVNAITRFSSSVA